MHKLEITLDTGESIVRPLIGEKVSLGRASSNDIVVQDGSISGHHAEFVLDKDAYRIFDLGSTNGTRVDDKPADGSLLKHGMQIIFGYVMANYVITEEEEAEIRQAKQEERKIEEMKKTKKIVLNVLPESESAQAELSEVSEKPQDFSSLSPFKNAGKKRDLVGVGIFSLAGLSILAMIAVIVLAFLKI